MARIFHSRWFYALIGMVVAVGIPALLFPGRLSVIGFGPAGAALAGWLAQKKKWTPTREEAERPITLSIFRDDSKK